MSEHLMHVPPWDEAKFAVIKDRLEIIEFPAKTVILPEGEIAEYIYFIRKGCLRLWFNKDGRDITFQFFFENQAVASIESFLSGQPGMFMLESIEPTVVARLSKNDFNSLGRDFPEMKEEFQKLIFDRFRNYAKLFLSRIRDTPKERYLDLLAHHPEIIRRVPQHYIASYLGITAVSLSRIRKQTG
jgi:CRP-like cAMP-binding protein